MVLRYTGTVTGRPHELVVQYARDGDASGCSSGRPTARLVAQPARPADVELWLAGEHVRARAVVSRAARTGPGRRGLAAYRHAVPRAPALPPAEATLVRADISRAA